MPRRARQVSGPDGSWKDWPEELVLNCHQKESGKTFGSVYGRMTWEEPSPTITTECIGLGNGRFGERRDRYLFQIEYEQLDNK